MFPLSLLPLARLLFKLVGAYPSLHLVNEFGPAMCPERGHKLFWFGFTALWAVDVFVSLAHFLNQFKGM